jgi:hypothetical protein
MLHATLSRREFVAIRLPIDEVRRSVPSGENAAGDVWARPSWLQFHFGFYYFPYASAVGRCPAPGRFDPS